MTLDAASLGPLTVGWLTYGAPVRIASSHPDSYQVNVPTQGSLVTVSGGQEVVGSSGLATAYRPDQPAVFSGWGTPAPVLALRISRRALDRELENLLDRPVRDLIDLPLGLDVAAGRGAQWLALVRSLAGQLADDDALIRQPAVAASFTHCVLAGLLMAAPHRYRDELASPAPPAGRSAVRAARDYIEANAGQPLTVAEIARAAGVGVRTLQQGFQRTTDMSPMQYLRQVRLREAHRELLSADPAGTSVAEVAARWGFLHQGRFAARYREHYDMLPADTLRRGQ
jgi:AraC-like DNA-binding protein